MRIETLEDIRLFVGSMTRNLKQSAKNLHSNGYHTMALDQENQAALGDRILKELAQETSNAR